MHSERKDICTPLNPSNLLVDEQGSLDALFMTLFLTSLFALVAGNALMMNAEVLQASALMWIPCFGLLLIFYALSRWLGGTLRGMLGTLVVAFALARLRQPWAGPLFYAFVAIAGGYAAVKMRPKGVPWVSIVLMAILATAVCFSAQSQFGDYNNLNAARAGLAHKDLLFHSSIAAMIKNYGVTSTGLNGLVEQQYYTVTHHIVALISLASGRGVFEVFGIVSHVFYIPLLIFSACVCAMRMASKVKTNLVISWVVICVLFVLPKILFSKWLISEGFLISVTDLPSKIVFLLALPLLLKPKMQVADLLFVGLATGIMAYSKLATATIYAGLWGARWLVGRRARGIMELAAFVLVASIVLYFMCPKFSAATTSQSYSEAYRLNFLQKSWGGNSIAQVKVCITEGFKIPFKTVVKALVAVGSFLCFHFFLSWIALGIVVFKKGVKVVFTSDLAIMIWASVAGGLFFVFFITFLDPNVVYPFLACSFFVALPVFAESVAATSLHLSKKSILTILLAATCLVCVLSYKGFYRNSRFSPIHRIRNESALIDGLRAVRKETPINSVMSAPKEVWKLEPVLWGSLYHLGLIHSYSEWCNTPWRSAAPLVFPAISERPWIGVIGPNESDSRYDSYNGWGYGQYDIDRVNGGVKTPPVLFPRMEVVDWMP